ncbi:unnamed protein product [Acanthosepion pharaonis]|uniref:Transmembrane protein n=1 Tax=Acanthosepion pharaonis TaxID=158019 RepID=A0A812DKU2_ACAPH|nr:unnamed protein product [Sepia pharaonis]
MQQCWLLAAPNFNTTLSSLRLFCPKLDKKRLVSSLDERLCYENCCLKMGIGGVKEFCLLVFSRNLLSFFSCLFSRILFRCLSSFLTLYDSPVCLLFLSAFHLFLLIKIFFFCPSFSISFFPLFPITFFSFQCLYFTESFILRPFLFSLMHYSLVFVHAFMYVSFFFISTFFVLSFVHL